MGRRRKDHMKPYSMYVPQHIFWIVVSKCFVDSSSLIHMKKEAVCISLHTNALGKGMDPSVLSQLWVNSGADWVFLALVRQRVNKKENTEFTPVLLRLNIDLWSHPARDVGIGLIYIKKTVRFYFVTFHMMMAWLFILRTLLCTGSWYQKLLQVCWHSLEMPSITAIYPVSTPFKTMDLVGLGYFI